MAVSRKKAVLSKAKPDEQKKTGKTLKGESQGMRTEQKVTSSSGRTAAAQKSDSSTANSRLSELKKALLAKRDAILSEAKQEIAKYISGDNRQLVDTAIDEGDWAAVDISEGLNMKRLAAQRRVLFDIEECLRKIKEGTYGICEECGEEISSKRLSVIPTATLCIDCKENSEKMAAFGEASEI